MTATVFLVEDQTLMRESMQAYLNAEPDLEVAGVAERAEDVFDRIDDDVPDLFLIDVALPGMSGIDLLRRLRQRHPDARYLMLSGHVEQTYVEAARNAGANGYVMKGKPDEYLEAIRQILDGATYRSESVASMWDQAATTP